MNHVISKVANGIGLITLNRPEAINALSLDMVLRLSKILNEWAADSKIEAVAIRGTDKNGNFGNFCAGGDIRFFHKTCIDENPDLDRFFTEEYKLNHLIFNYSKPYIAFMDGIVMGGGAGLMFGSSYKISTERTRFAMPEIGVGLFPDVGFTSVIKTLPKGLGLYMMLTSTQLNSSDTVFCDLTNASINSKDIDRLLIDLMKQIWHDEPEENIAIIDSIVKNNSYTDKIKEFPESKIMKELDKIQSLTDEKELSKVCSNILLNQTDDDWYLRGKNSLQKGSPTSAHLIWLQCLNSSNLNLKEVFKFELNLAIQITRIGDFKEGIRALIIDKDNNPKWKYDSVKSVPPEWIKKHTDPAWQQNPLEDI